MIVPEDKEKEIDNNGALLISDDNNNAIKTDDERNSKGVPSSSSSVSSSLTSQSQSQRDCLLMALPIPIRSLILNCLGETQEECITLTLVSKSLYQDCHRKDIIWKLVPTLEIIPRFKMTRILLRKLMVNQINNNSYNKRYKYYCQRIVIHRINEFGPISYWDADHIVNKFMNSTSTGTRIIYDKSSIVPTITINEKDETSYHPLSLDVSLPPESLKANYRRMVDPSVIIHTIRCILVGSNTKKKNVLKEINFTNIIFPPQTTDRILHFLSYLHYSAIEKFVWNRSDNIYLSGQQFCSARNPNLKELILNDTDFLVPNNRRNRLFHDYSDLVDHPCENYIFEDCIKYLQRLSIKNSKCSSDFRCRDSSLLRVDIPQAAIIKLIRNAPSTFTYLESDLTTENIIMLQKERPDIEFR